jgi:hypothetical protein
MSVVHITFQLPYDEAVLAEIKHFLQDRVEQVEMVVEPEPFDPTIKLTHGELFALPQEQRFQYYDANGGVFAVMHESGCGFSQELVDSFHRMQEEEDKEWEIEYKRRYGKDLPR